MPDRPTYRPVYKALHRPLTIWGVDRRLFFLSLLLGAATFNLFYSFLAGLLMAGGLYGFALWATARDPEMLRILLASSKARQTVRPWQTRTRRHGGRAVVRIGRILRDYQDAGSVNGLLALWGFVDDTTFLTKAGHVGVVYRLRGVDYEGLSHPQRQALAHRFEAGLRLLDEHCRVYQYLLKRTVAPFVAGACDQPIANEAIQRRAAYLNGRRHDLYDLSLYLVLLYEAPHVVRRSTELRGLWQAPREALRAWLSTDRTLQLLESELDRAIGTLHHKAQAFEVQISDFGPARLQKPRPSGSSASS